MDAALQQTGIITSSGIRLPALTTTYSLKLNSSKSALLHSRRESCQYTTINRRNTQAYRTMGTRLAISELHEHMERLQTHNRERWMSYWRDYEHVYVLSGDETRWNDTKGSKVIKTSATSISSSKAISCRRKVQRGRELVRQINELELRLSLTHTHNLFNNYQDLLSPFPSSWRSYLGRYFSLKDDGIEYLQLCCILQRIQFGLFEPPVITKTTH